MRLLKTLGLVLAYMAVFALGFLIGEAINLAPLWLQVTFYVAVVVIFGWCLYQEAK